MKYIIPLILLLMLTGCSDKSDYITTYSIDATNARIDVVREEIHRLDNQSTNRYNHTLDELEILKEWKYIETKRKEREEQSCIPFHVEVGDTVYKDITESQNTDERFWKQHGETLKLGNKMFLKSKVISYGVELDCITHINKLGYDRIKEID